VRERWWVRGIPEKLMLFLVSDKALLRPSTTNKNRRGERGHPYQSPFFAGKKGEVAPFMSTTKETVVMQLMIQFIKEKPKPRCVSRSFKKIQLTRS
jgi:hypothetical protein